jgi:Flp pilus assembly protein CpaB
MQGATGTQADQGATHTVTIEVTDMQAERVALGARLGHLSLIVRAAGAALHTPAGRPTTTWGGDVSAALNQGHANGRTVRVYEGTSDGKEHRF